VSSLVLVPLAPASLVPESLAATSPPLPFLALASRVPANVDSVVVSFLALIKLVLIFLARLPALISPLFSAALFSLVQASLVQASPVPVSPALVSCPILHAPASAA